MISVAIRFGEKDHAWLEREAQRQEVPKAEVVRRALRHYRRALEDRTMQRLLEETSGIWSGEDGLSYQRRLRAQWDDR